MISFPVKKNFVEPAAVSEILSYRYTYRMILLVLQKDYISYHLPAELSFRFILEIAQTRIKGTVTTTFISRLNEKKNIYAIYLLWKIMKKIVVRRISLQITYLNKWT